MTGTTNMSISDSAQRYIAHMRQKQGNPALRLRVAVLGGGCSGFQYQLSFDDATTPDDVAVGEGDTLAVTDEMSLPFLQNAVIDYEQTLMGSAIRIRNPNAAAGCGCGKSFAVDM